MFDLVVVAAAFDIVVVVDLGVVVVVEDPGADVVRQVAIRNQYPLKLGLLYRYEFF